jgi:predicted GIY-YIG superfamily endonuclease
MAEAHYYVYIVLLSSEVLKHQKFIKANVSYKAGEPCVYVGMTGLDPDTRFDKHKAGVQANGYVHKYGLRLMPELVDDLKQPMTYKDAQYLEVEVGIKLKKLGYAVCQA